MGLKVKENIIILRFFLTLEVLTRAADQPKRTENPTVFWFGSAPLSVTGSILNEIIITCCYQNLRKY